MALDKGTGSPYQPPKPPKPQVSYGAPSGPYAGPAGPISTQNGVPTYADPNDLYQARGGVNATPENNFANNFMSGMMGGYLAPFRPSTYTQMPASLNYARKHPGQALHQMFGTAEGAGGLLAGLTMAGIPGPKGVGFLKGAKAAPEATMAERIVGATKAPSTNPHLLGRMGEHADVLQEALGPKPTPPAPPGELLARILERQPDFGTVAYNQRRAGNVEPTNLPTTPEMLPPAARDMLDQMHARALSENAARNPNLGPRPHSFSPPLERLGTKHGTVTPGGQFVEGFPKSFPGLDKLFNTPSDSVAAARSALGPGALNKRPGGAPSWSSFLNPYGAFTDAAQDSVINLGMRHDWMPEGFIHDPAPGAFEGLRKGPAGGGRTWNLPNDVYDSLGRTAQGNPHGATPPQTPLDMSRGHAMRDMPDMAGDQYTENPFDFNPGEPNFADQEGNFSFHDPDTVHPKILDLMERAGFKPGSRQFYSPAEIEAPEWFGRTDPAMLPGQFELGPESGGWNPLNFQGPQGNMMHPDLQRLVQSAVSRKRGPLYRFGAN